MVPITETALAAQDDRPAAQGALRERPLPRLLLQLFRKRVTGHLVVVDDSGDESRVYLREGYPVYVHRPNDLDILAQILLELGAVAPDALAQAQAVSVESNRRLGDVLIERGALTPQGLNDALKTQQRRKLVRLFFTREGKFEVFVTPHNYGAGDDFAAMRLDPRTFLLSSIRTAYDDHRLRGELAFLENRSFRLTNGAAAALPGMGFAPDDRTVAALAGQPLTLDRLTALGAKPQEARVVVLSLFYADLLDVQPPLSRETGPAPVLGERRDSAAFAIQGGGAGTPAAAGAAPDPRSARPSAQVPPLQEPRSPRPSAPIAPLAGDRPVRVSSSLPPLDLAGAGAPADGVPSLILGSGAAPSDLGGLPPLELTPPPVAAQGAPPPVATSSAARVQAALAAAAPARPSTPVIRRSTSITELAASAETAPAPTLRELAEKSRASAPPSSSGLPAVTPATPAGARPQPRFAAPPPPKFQVGKAAPSLTSTSAPPPAAPPATSAPATTPELRATVRHPTPPGVGAGGDFGDVRARLKELSDALDTLDHFGVLGVDEKATAEEINAAYVRAVRHIHPDRLAGTPNADLIKEAERVFSRIGDAHATLTDPKKRADFLYRRNNPNAAPSSSRSILEAETLFQKGEVLLKRADHARAVELFAEAVKLNPAESQYRAYLAWARFDDPSARKDALVRETLRVLEETVKDRARFALGHFWVGQCWKYLNEMSKAIESFREAVELDPQLIEAQRELRLLEMRRSKVATQERERETARGAVTANKQGGPGLFGKIFKK